IEYSNKKGYKINNLKLQKLLYFVNVRNILENGAPLFEESMEKWKYGPVVPDVYHEYKRFGAFSISTDEMIMEYVEFSVSPFGELSDLEITEYDSQKVENTQLIENTVDALHGFGPFELVDITHDHTPWKKYEDRIMDGVQGIKYTIEEIKDFFGHNPGAKIWVQ
ncbi:TPA: Panacea domain-containing protein, partial [Streptococcus pyogenes]